MGEMKFSTDLCGITDSYELKLKERTGLFSLTTKNKKALVITFVTTYGMVIRRGSVTETAYALGFDFPSHLSRLFNRLEGRTPSVYLKQASKRKA